MLWRSKGSVLMKKLRIAVLFAVLLPLSACKNNRPSPESPDGSPPPVVRAEGGTYAPDPDCKDGKCPWKKIKVQEESK